MKSANPNAGGIIFTLTSIGIFFVALIVLLVADVEVGSFFEDQVNGAVNSEIHSRANSVGSGLQSGAKNSNSLFYEFGN